MARWCVFDSFDDACLSEDSLPPDALRNPKASAADKSAALAKSPVLWGATLTLVNAAENAGAHQSSGGAAAAAADVVAAQRDADENPNPNHPAQRDADGGEGGVVAIYTVPAIHTTKRVRGRTF